MGLREALGGGPGGSAIPRYGHGVRTWGVVGRERRDQILRVLREGVYQDS